MNVDLSNYSASPFERGAGRFKEALWLLVSLVLFRLCPLKLSSLKCAVLRAFGGRVGTGVVIKPDVHITFPWKLTVGDNVWFGDECWLLNLAHVEIESHVCISPRAMVCTGSHDYKSPHFDLITRPVTIGRGAWLGAGAWVGPGVKIGQHAVLMAASVTTKDLEAFGVYRGNPATFIRKRVITPKIES